MNPTIVPILSPEDYELDRLDDFLRERAANDSLLLDGVHGLLTALAVGPAPAQPDEWLPQVLGRPFEDNNEGGQVLGMLARLNESIPEELASEDYAPILGAVEESMDAARLSAAGWCEGFSRGIDLRAALWESRMADDPELMEMLGPIMALGVDEGVFQSDGEFERLSSNDYSDCLQQIPLAVAALRHYWRVNPLSTLERRMAGAMVMPGSPAQGSRTLH